MIIGKGLLGRALADIDHEEICFFASGVSNSAENRQEEFARESSLLQKTIEDHHDKSLVYFSTCSLYETSFSMYAKHKLEMEKLIQANSSKYFIFRLPQVVGKGGNPHTLLNFLVNKIHHNEPFEVWQHVKRNFIDVDDIIHIVNKIIHDNNSKNMIINIASPYSISLLKVINLIELYFNKEADFTLVNKGTQYLINIDFQSEIVNTDKLFLDDAQSYINKLLIKYYTKDDQ